MINYEEIGKEIRKARTERGLSQEELAEMAYVSTSYVSNIERGKANLSFDALNNIINLLYISPDVQEKIKGLLMPKYRKSRSSICFECRYAYGGSKCKWINFHKPIEGWTAEPVVKKVKEEGRTKNVSFIKITKCPLFEEGGLEHKKLSQISDYY